MINQPCLNELTSLNLKRLHKIPHLQSEQMRMLSASISTVKL